MTGPAPVLISACLLGERVRYDGGHKRCEPLLEALHGRVRWIPVCPEVECGLPVPRESMRLAGTPSAPRLVGTESGADHTRRMLRWAEKRLRDLASHGVCGYVCKRNSPSCSGQGRIEVFGDAGEPARPGTGLFTKAFLERFPSVPVEEELPLQDPVLRKRFLEKAFALRRSTGSR